jgi:hypothetical protein
VGSDSASTPAVDPALDPEREAQIEKYVVAIRALHCQTVRDRMKIGEYLNKIKTLKADVPHGQFTLWVKRSFLFGIRSAQRWMRIDKAFEGKSVTVSLLPITWGALYRLSADDVPEGTRDEAIKIAQSGTGINKDHAKSLVFEAKRKIKVEAGNDADLFVGLTPEDVGKLTNTFGFFHDDPSDLLRSEHDSTIPPWDVISWIVEFKRRISEVQNRESYRRRAHMNYLGNEQRDRAFAKIVWSRLADVVVEIFSDAVHLDLLAQKLIKNQQEKVTKEDADVQVKKKVDSES